jgi:CxxC motif-containing protein (DUF1111 family)
LKKKSVFNKVSVMPCRIRPAHFAQTPRPARSRRLGALVMLALLGACDDEPAEPLTLVGDDPSDAPIADLSDVWLERHADGDALFEHPTREGDGLGPVYIRQSCGSCHASDAKGPGGVTKLVLVEADGTPAADQSGLPWGQTVRPRVAGGATTPIEAPDRPDLRTSRRIGPAVFGRGYLEAVTDAEIERIAAEQATRDDGISGRIHRVPYQSETASDPAFGSWAPGDEGLIGRFGVKARLATLEEFSADAAQGDMSLTSPMRPQELPNPDELLDDLRPGLDLDEEQVRLMADYIRVLAIPTRPAADPEGLALFLEARCHGCHVPSLHTRADYPIEPLADIEAPIYSDLLLHDMGVGLTDWRPEGDAAPQEWRTAPLMGLRHLVSYLHDGRATTLRDAVLQHRSDGSEANDSIERFERLSADDQERLLDFVSTL